MATQLEIMHTGRNWKGQSMALATVVNAWGSAPRPRGSHMLMLSDGRFAGSVSGGCVETDVLFHGARVAAGAPAVLKRYGIADAALWEVGLPCGGEIEVYIQPVNAAGFSSEIFAAVADRIESGETQIVATDLRTGASRCVAEPLPDHFNNTYRPPRRMLLVGAVDIAQGLSIIATTVGFAVTVIDPRARFLTRERFHRANLDSRWPDEAVRALRPDVSTALVTLSHDAKLDDAALIAALESDAGYVAALGSVRSHAARVARLRLCGIDEEAIARIDAPAGLRIGAVGPNEIALSIAAGAVAALGSRAPVRSRMAHYA
jgi:xanthine dehydrogenase accessory factor